MSSAWLRKLGVIEMKPERKETDMPLMRNKDGTFVIRNKKEAQQAVEMAQGIKAAIKEEIEDAGNLMRAAAHYVRDHMNGDQLPVGNKHFNLVRPTKRVWVTTDEDLPDNPPDECVPLEELVDKKTFAKLTRRVADPEKIETAIGLGLVDEDTIAPAYLEIQNPQSVYLR